MNALALVALFGFVLHAGIKVAGVEFIPSDLIFATADPHSRATAEGQFADGCKWTYISQTRVAKKEDEKGCVRYFYKTTVSLEQNCPAPNEKLVTRRGERVTSTGPHCADGSGKIPPPVIEAHVLSSGDMPDGKHQDIVVQPDGTRITLQYDSKLITATAAFPDGTVDALSLP